MTTLQLGCGIRPLQGAVNHDLWRHHDYVDVEHDLNWLPWPFEDASFDKIIALDVMEHLHPEVQEWLDECWRILRPGGQLVLRLPGYANPVSWRDPTHNRVYHHESFHYWDRRTQLWNDYGSFYFGPGYDKWWTVLRVVNVNPPTPSGDLGVVLQKDGTP
jgi:SAM-dependent methyltransferase